LYLICHTCTKEKLQCPADSKRSDVGAGYKSFADTGYCQRLLMMRVICHHISEVCRLITVPVVLCLLR